MLHAERLTCIVDDRPLFAALTLSLAAGELLQVAGDNGAGKTSLLRILCGLARPESGVVSWQGQPLAKVRESFHRQLLWLGHKPGVNAALTADENLRFFFPASRLQQRESALAAVGLAGYEDLPLSQLSAGQQRRVALTRLWLTDAPLWILDEPFTALDATAMETLTRRLEQHARQGDAPSSPPTSRCGRWAVRCAPCASAATLEAGNDACAVGPGTAPGVAQRGGDPQSALVLSDRHHPVSVRRRRRAAAAGADCAGRGVDRRAAGGAAGDGSVVSRRLAGRFPGATDAPADAAGGGGAGEGGCPLDDERPAAADRLAAGGAAAGDESA